MDSTGGGSGISSLLETTKTKLLVLSSILGVSAIFYLTKNYLEKGQFLPTWSNTPYAKKSILKRQATIIGGQRHVVIKEDERTPGSTQILRRQRSRRSSRSSVRRSRSICSTVAEDITEQDVNNVTDVNLNEAISDLSKSMSEAEEVLGIKDEKVVKSNRSSVVIENEVNRLRQLLDFAQDIQLVTEKTNNYLVGQHNSISEEVMQIDDASELTRKNYNDIVDIIRNQKKYDEESEYDSDNDSFLSAAESVEFQDSTEDIVTFEKKLKELIGKHSKHDYYMHGIEYLTHYGVPVRSIRTELLDCDNDVDFCVKVHCIRRAFKNILKNKEYEDWFIECGKELLSGLIKKADYDESQFLVDFDELIDYCVNANNWDDIEDELSERGICYLNFYDIILDFLLMDSFQDLENPPSGITTAIHNRWLSLRIKETALSTAIWAVIKGKKRMLKNPAGFFARFYDISMHITPVLAWGFLGPVEDLNKLCSSFKKSALGFLCDIFSTNTASYKSVHSLSEDIMRLAKRRKEELITLIS